MPASGGYFARDWAPAGLAVVGLFLVAVMARRRLLPAGRSARAAVLALVALAAFAYLSIAWAASPGTAWGTANQFATVVLAVWALALLPWSAGWAQLLMGLYGVGAAVALFGALLSALSAPDITYAFIERRWAEPLGYPNGLGNFGFFAAIPLIAISASPGRSVPVKALALGVATAAAGCGLLPQSRGALLALMFALPVLVALSPRRWRLLARLAVVGGAIAWASGPIFDVYDALGDERTLVSPALEEAARAIALAAAAAVAGGLVLALLESRLALGAGGVRAARLSGFALAGLVVLGLAGVAAANADRIVDVVEKEKRAWETPQIPFEGGSDDGGSRLLNPDPLQRYEYWHVSLDAFAERPLGGLGAGGFEKRYTEERTYTKYAAFPHALFMRTVAEAGLVGVLGVLAFIASVLLGLAAGLRRAGPEQRTVVAAAVSGAVLFVVHAQLDWLEEFPPLAGAAVGFLLVALAVVRPPEPADEEATSPAWARPARVAGAVALGAAVAVSVALPYVSLRYRERADALWRAEPARAYDDLERAARLDPLSPTPKILEGTIALQRRDYRRARAAFRSAQERERTWLGHFELALLEAAEGDQRAAMRQLAEAGRLNPLEGALAAAREEILSGKAIDPGRLNRQLFESPLFNPRRLT